MSNRLDTDQARLQLGLIWVQNVCKGNQQKTLEGKELINMEGISRLSQTDQINHSQSVQLLLLDYANVSVRHDLYVINLNYYNNF